MDVEEVGGSDAVVEFLSKEAPFELERLRSIGRLVASWTEPDPSWPNSGAPSCSPWLQETFGLFNDPRNWGVLLELSLESGP